MLKNRSFTVKSANDVVQNEIGDMNQTMTSDFEAAHIKSSKTLREESFIRKINEESMSLFDHDDEGSVESDSDEWDCKQIQ